jgi:L-lactate dehydrogenase complex protein LldF
LSFASSLCGKCVEVCPVKIPLTDILLSNRRQSVEQNLRPEAEKWIMKGFRLVSSTRKGFDIFPGWLKTMGTYPFNFIGWGPKRSMPSFAAKSFSQQFKNKQK